MDVFGIERGDECLVQPPKNVVDDLVSFSLQDANLLGRAFEPRVARFRSLQQQRSGFGDVSHLIKKQRKELLFARKELHNTSADSNIETGTVRTFIFSTPVATGQYRTWLR